MFMLLFSDLSDKKSPQILTIREKGSISLKCVFTGHEEVAWYRLSSYTLTLLISAQKSHAENSLPVYYNKYDSRFVLRPNSEITTAEFTIMNLTKEDLGVYFCGITAEPAQMHFGRATILQFEGLCPFFQSICLLDFYHFIKTACTRKRNLYKITRNDPDSKLNNSLANSSTTISNDSQVSWT